MKYLLPWIGHKQHYEIIILPLASLDLVIFLLQKKKNNIHMDLNERNQPFTEARNKIKGPKFNFMLLTNA